MLLVTASLCKQADLGSDVVWPRRLERPQLVLSFVCRRAGDRGKPTELQAASNKLDVLDNIGYKFSNKGERYECSKKND